MFTCHYNSIVQGKRDGYLQHPSSTVLFTHTRTLALRPDQTVWNEPGPLQRVDNESTDRWSFTLTLILTDSSDPIFDLMDQVQLLYSQYILKTVQLQFAKNTVLHIAILHEVAQLFP